MKTRRIVFYMHDLSGGGVERMRLALIAELRLRGEDVRLVVNRLCGPLVPLLPSDLIVEELATSRMLAAVMPLVRYLRRVRPDILIASLDHNNITALLAGTVAGVHAAVIICQHNALSAERALGWRYRAVPWLYWMLQSRAKGIVAVSHSLADDLSAVAGIRRERITTIYNPVIDAGFAARASPSAPHIWLADRRCPVFVFAGRLTQQKDPITLLDAMALLLLSRRARLILLGDGPLRPALETQATMLGIADHVAFVGFQANPLPWIRHADALVSASRYEGFGNALVEALACGTPVIATDCPHGPAEILMGGAIGSLVAVGDSAALAQAMQAQIDAPRHALALTTRAACFTAEACADAHLALIRQVTSSPAVRALGLQFSSLQAEQVLDHVLHDTIENGPRLVVTPNLDHIRLLRNKAFATAYGAAFFICPDGLPVLLYARLRGLRLSARVTGCALFHLLANHPDLYAHRLCVVVESQQTASSLLGWAAERSLLPNITVLVAPAGLLQSPDAQCSLASEIEKARPTILVMTLGAPLSEMFVHHYSHVLGACWALCVGQAVRVELGLTARAPALWQKFGMEWLWRIRQEPERLVGRYAKALIWFPIAVFRDMFVALVGSDQLL